uniref:Reverse transcriptase domain-containing protein n=1 Tax=Tanacetum cinerariifolium TaxID=118510 RepID=A0A699HYA7_TANCI|nr:hypothetical protein [Tanacetum cinerariifolium]
MVDSKHSIVTYTSISSDDGSMDVGSLGVIVLGYDGLPMMLENPYAYVETAMQDPPPLDFVPEPAYPEFMPPEDDDLEEEDDEDPEEDPADYPTNRDDEKEEEHSRDDAHDEEEDEGKDKEEEEEEHLASANSVPPPVHLTTARMSIRAQTPIPFSSETEVVRLLAIPTLSQSPLTSYSSPLPQIPSSPLHASSTHPLGYRAAMLRLRAESSSTSHPLLPPPIIFPHTRASMVMKRAVAPSTYILAPRSERPPLLHIPLPTSSPPLLLPSTDCRANVLKVTSTRGFRADYSFVGTLDVKIRRDPDWEIGYEITDAWEDPDEIAKEIPVTDVAELELLVRLRYSVWMPVIRHVLRTLQTQMVSLQSQQRPARDPAYLDVPKEADRKSTRRTERTARECTYTDFLKCQPMNFKATKGVKPYVKTVGQDAAHGMSWNTLMKMMTAKYCHRNVIKKLEIEI